MPHLFDASAKLFLQWGVEDWLALAGVEAPGRVVELDSDISSVSARVDKILRIETSEPYIEHLVIQAQRDNDVPIRLYRYGALIHYQQRVPVVSSVVLLSPTADMDELTGVYQIFDRHGELTLQYRYQIIRLWEIPAEKLCQAGIGVLGLAPLGKMEPNGLPNVIERMKARVQAELEPTQRSEFWTGASLLMGLRHPSEIINEVLMSPIYVEDSSIGRQWIEQGMQQGIETGRQEEAARNVLRLLNRRFASVDAQTQLRIESIANIAILEELFDLAYDAPTLDLFIKELQKHGERTA